MRTEHKKLFFLSFALIVGIFLGFAAWNIKVKNTAGEAAYSLAPTYCRETDGGDNEFVKSATTGIASGKRYFYTDRCVKSNQLKEYYCDGPNKAERFYDCSCSFGRCKRVTD